MISTFVQGMKARSSLPPRQADAPKPEDVRHFSLYPWRPTRLPPFPTGMRVLAPVRDKETGKDAMLRGTIMERRRGWARCLSDETRDNDLHAMKTGIAYDLKTPPYTRDQAGLYMVRLEGGRVTFAHGSELIADERLY